MKADIQREGKNHLHCNAVEFIRIFYLRFGKNSKGINGLVLFIIFTVKVWAYVQYGYCNIQFFEYKKIFCIQLRRSYSIIIVNNRLYGEIEFGYFVYNAIPYSSYSSNCNRILNKN